MQHGPIDLIIEAIGDCASVAMAYQQAHEAFQSVLVDLVEELGQLRKPLGVGLPSGVGSPSGVGLSEPEGRVAKRMYAAALPFAQGFVTPMVAVAGSVADHVLQAMLERCSLSRAYVNNGGDIALWLARDERFVVGICENTETGKIGSHVTLQGDDATLGIATSGWRGRSYSLGIADAVTVLASSAATADAAATIIANAVDVSRCDGIHRQPAMELSPDSDLGSRPVTVAVDQLEPQFVQMALEHGRKSARELIAGGLIDAAYISLQGINTVCSRQTLCTGATYA